MTIQQLFVLSNQELLKVVMQIKDEQWAINMPAGVTSKPATLKQSVNYHAYDDAWVPDILHGKTKEQVADKYEPLLVSTDTITEYKKHNQLASAVVQDFTELKQITHLSYGDFSARDYLQHITIFRALRVYDIAELVGVSTIMNPEFVVALLEQYLPLEETYRQFGIFPPALPEPPNASVQTKFLCLVGRQ